MALLTGFADAALPLLRAHGLGEQASAARFLLTLAGRSGEVSQWPNADRDILIRKVLDAPVLLRLARFAVLGARMFDDADDALKGF